MKNEIDIFTQKSSLMIRKIRLLGFFLIFTTFFVASQEVKVPIGHKNNNNFKQLYEEFSTPNRYRTASGSPGKDYYQQKVDYTMNIILDDENLKKPAPKPSQKLVLKPSQKPVLKPSQNQF